MGNPDSESQTRYVLTYRWMLAVRDNHATAHGYTEAKEQGSRDGGGGHMNPTVKGK